MLLIGRPLPVGDVYRAFGGFLAISRQAADGMLDAIHSGDAADIIECIARTFAPPRIHNTDGHDLVFHTMRWRMSEPEATIDRHLTAAGLQRDLGEPAWRMLGPGTGGMESIIATLELNGDVLIGNVNSDERAELLTSLVTGALPTAVWIGEDAESLDEAMNDRTRPEREELPTELDPHDPEVQAALANWMAEYERKWIDESIPALGGRSPRDAVTDPVGREQVLQLLDSFPPPNLATGFTGLDPDRIRTALGL